MDLLVVRHAIAESREEFARSGGEDDAERPLTPEGRRKFEKGARGLRKLAGGVELLATSLLARATQTSDILEAQWPGKLRVVRLRELAPETDPAALLGWLRRHRRRKLVAVVGHEPHLSRLVELALTGRSSEFVDLKKGGACLLSLGKSPRAGGATLRWLLTPAQLRRLGR
ncbi:MAG TPA: histidine phosphatase family protein [Anaeromyxobacter sp.]